MKGGNNMAIYYLIQGLIIGFSIAAPVGPIGILCIRRTLGKGALTGFVSGLGAATADAVYGGIAGFGLTAVADILLEQQFMLRLIGGGFLSYLGVAAFIAKPAERAAETKERTGLGGAYLSTLALTIANPMTILSFAAVFAGLGLVNTGGDILTAGFMVLGVFLGSSLWWLTLSGLVGSCRHKLDYRGLLWVNRISGLIITGFGIAAVCSIIR